MSPTRAQRRRDPVFLRVLSAIGASLVLASCAGTSSDVAASNVAASTPASASHSPTPPTATPMSQPTAHEAACSSSQLTPSLDQQHTGGAGGTEYVVILFRNTSSHACWLGGYPDFTGVTAAGAAKPLVFSLKTNDPAQVITAPAGPPGVLQPGGLGAVNLTLMDHDCPAPIPAYRTLRISVGQGADLQIPFPPALEITRCLSTEAEMGPIG